MECVYSYNHGARTGLYLSLISITCQSTRGVYEGVNARITKISINNAHRTCKHLLANQPWHRLLSCQWPPWQTHTCLSVTDWVDSSEYLQADSRSDFNVVRHAKCAKLYFLSLQAVSALTVMDGQQEGHPACKKSLCWDAGCDDLSGALFVLGQVARMLS